MSRSKYFTEEGLQRLRNELEQLRTIERPKISQHIAEARDKGDLSENAEYDAAKEAQGLLELKISKLQGAFHLFRSLFPFSNSPSTSNFKAS